METIPVRQPGSNVLLEKRAPSWTWRPEASNPASINRDDRARHDSGRAARSYLCRSSVSADQSPASGSYPMASGTSLVGTAGASKVKREPTFVTILLSADLYQGRKDGPMYIRQDSEQGRRRGMSFDVIIFLADSLSPRWHEETDSLDSAERGTTTEGEHHRAPLESPL